MTTRTSAETIKFQHPFHLVGVEGPQPAGPYLVETDEEMLPSFTVKAYRRLATFIHLPGPPNSNILSRIVDIEPGELAAVVARDRAVPGASPPTVKSAPASAGTKSFALDRWTRRVFASPPT